MSLNSVSNPTGTCVQCGDDFELPGIDRDFCSERCYHTDRGEKALNTVRSDHTKCSSCGRIRADLEPPKPDEAFAIDWSYGSAYFAEPEANGGVHFEAFGQDESKEAAIGFRYPTDAEEQGVCKCGTIGKEGDGHFDVLHNVAAEAMLLRLRKRIKEAAIDGQRETWPSRGELLRTFRDTEDLAYSVGVSL